MNFQDLLRDKAVKVLEMCGKDQHHLLTYDEVKQAWPHVHSAARRAP